MVTLANHPISVLSAGQGRPPLRPIPSFGVAARMSVRGNVAGEEGARGPIVVDDVMDASLVVVGGTEVAESSTISGRD